MPPPRLAVPLMVAALAAASFLLPFAPLYDVWAWLVWGREVTGLDLDTGAGPSWKPLPVVFTTAFAPAGDAAPELWLVVARIGWLASIALAWRLASRLVAGRRSAHQARRRARPGSGPPGAVRRGRDRGARHGAAARPLHLVDAPVRGRPLRAPAGGACAGGGRPPPLRPSRPGVRARGCGRAAAPRVLAVPDRLRVVALDAVPAAAAAWSSAARSRSSCCGSASTCWARATRSPGWSAPRRAPAGRRYEALEAIGRALTWCSPGFGWRRATPSGPPGSAASARSSSWPQERWRGSRWSPRSPRPATRASPGSRHPPRRSAVSSARSASSGSPRVWAAWRAPTGAGPRLLPPVRRSRWR